MLFNGGGLREHVGDRGDAGQRRHLSDDGRPGAQTRLGARRPVADALVRHVRLLGPVRLHRK